MLYKQSGRSRVAEGKILFYTVKSIKSENKGCQYCPAESELNSSRPASDRVRRSQGKQNGNWSPTVIILNKNQGGGKLIS